MTALTPMYRPARGDRIGVPTRRGCPPSPATPPLRLLLVGAGATAWAYVDAAQRSGASVCGLIEADPRMRFGAALMLCLNGDQVYPSWDAFVRSGHVVDAVVVTRRNPDEFAETVPHDAVGLPVLVEPAEHPDSTSAADSTADQVEWLVEALTAQRAIPRSS